MIVLVPHPDKSVEFPREKTKRVLHHLAFRVDGSAYEELQERLTRAGLEVRSGVHPVLKGVRTFYVDDPDGNEVECISLDRDARDRLGPA
jgi:catechol 2,3-dioxygenase-like lactoylglutathione lyase family enzyme